MRAVVGLGGAAVTGYAAADRYINGRLVEDGCMQVMVTRDDHGHPMIRVTYIRDTGGEVEQIEATVSVEDVRALVAALEEVIR